MRYNRKEAIPPPGGFRLQLKTQDGSLVGNRVLSTFVMETPYDKRFIDDVVRTEARTKGVRVLGYDIVPEGINVTVEWL